LYLLTPANPEKSLQTSSVRVHVSLTGRPA
jgi:hypothetical protein